MPIILNTSVSSTFQKLAGKTIVSKSFIIYIFLKYREQANKGKRVKKKRVQNDISNDISRFLTLDIKEQLKKK